MLPTGKPDNSHELLNRTLPMPASAHPIADSPATGDLIGTRLNTSRAVLGIKEPAHLFLCSFFSFQRFSFQPLPLSSIQHAADAVWPWSSEANRPIRKTFRLPLTRPMGM